MIFFRARHPLFLWFYFHIWYLKMSSSWGRLILSWLSVYIFSTHVNTDVKKYKGLRIQLFLTRTTLHAPTGVVSHDRNRCEKIFRTLVQNVGPMDIYQRHVCVMLVWNNRPLDRDDSYCPETYNRVQTQAQHGMKTRVRGRDSTSRNTKNHIPTSIS